MQAQLLLAQRRQLRTQALVRAHSPVQACDGAEDVAGRAVGGLKRQHEPVVDDQPVGGEPAAGVLFAPRRHLRQQPPALHDGRELLACRRQRSAANDALPVALDAVRAQLDADRATRGAASSGQHVPVEAGALKPGDGAERPWLIRVPREPDQLWPSLSST